MTRPLFPDQETLCVSKGHRVDKGRENHTGLAEALAFDRQLDSGTGNLAISSGIT
jgi:hypothetical protein